MKIANLRTEYQREPLGIDRRNPRFSWELTAETWERDKFQHAYWIQAASDEHLLTHQICGIPVSSKEVRHARSGIRGVLSIPDSGSFGECV
ncbi:MAG: hypothetical protein ACLR23_10145 [Clostridia bacterium]